MKAADRPHFRPLSKAAVVAIFAAMAGITIADSVVVKQEVEIHPKTSVLSPPVETVPADTKLEKLGIEHGWVKVRTPAGNTGYIQVDDLPPNTNVASLQGNAQVKGLSTSAAGNGLQDDAEKYAATNNLDPAPLKELIAAGDAIDSKSLREFDAAGHLGPREYRN